MTFMKIITILVLSVLLVSCGTVQNNTYQGNSASPTITNSLGSSPIQPLPSSPMEWIISDAMWEGTGDYDSFY